MEKRWLSVINCSVNLLLSKSTHLQFPKAGMKALGMLGIPRPLKTSLLHLSHQHYQLLPHPEPSNQHIRTIISHLRKQSVGLQLLSSAKLLKNSLSSLSSLTHFVLTIVSEIKPSRKGTSQEHQSPSPSCSQTLGTLFPVLTLFYLLATSSKDDLALAIPETLSPGLCMTPSCLPLPFWVPLSLLFLTSTSGSSWDLSSL